LDTTPAIAQVLVTFGGLFLLGHNLTRDRLGRLGRIVLSISGGVVLAAGGLLLLYLAVRVAGRVLGAALGGHLSLAPPEIRCWMGLAMLPQAGLAIGIALLASQRFPDAADVILPVVLGSTVVFELLGPVATRWTLQRAGDIPGPER